MESDRIPTDSNRNSDRILFFYFFCFFKIEMEGADRPWPSHANFSIWSPSEPAPDGVHCPSEQCRWNGRFRQNQFPTPVIPTTLFGLVFRRKIIFSTEKVIFSVENSVRKIRLFLYSWLLFFFYDWLFCFWVLLLFLIVYFLFRFFFLVFMCMFHSQWGHCEILVWGWGTMCTYSF